MRVYRKTTPKVVAGKARRKNRRRREPNDSATHPVRIERLKPEPGYRDRRDAPGTTAAEGLPVTRRAPARIGTAVLAFVAVSVGCRGAAPRAEAEPPRLISLTRDEYRPAYLFYPTPLAGGAKDLRGKRQRFQTLPASLEGDRTLIEAPAGTDVVLSAVADKPVKGARLLPPREGAAEVQAEVALAADDSEQKTLRARLDNVQGTLRFVLAFTAADGTTGRRPVTVRAIADRPPEVDLAVEVVRKTPQGYLVTPTASIPFRGKVRDDHGLESVAYVVTVARLGATGQAGKGEKEQELPVGGFARLLRQREATNLPLQEMVRRLGGQPPPSALVKECRLDPDDPAWALDLSKLPRTLKETDERSIQPRYRLRVGLAAADNDVETGPHTTRTQEPFTLLVVSENELLVEVAKEEERLRLDLTDGADRLREARAAVRGITQDLAAAKPEPFGALGERAARLGKGFERTSAIARDVQTDYRRILQELKANRVNAGMIKRVEKGVCEPLEATLRREFTQAKRALGELGEALKGRDADLARKAGLAAGEQLDSLGDRLDKVVAAMNDLATVNQLLKVVQDLQQQERNQADELKGLLDKLKERR
jgi:hypothetical protein